MLKPSSLKWLLNRRIYIRGEHFDFSFQLSHTTPSLLVLHIDDQFHDPIRHTHIYQTKSPEYNWKKLKIVASIGLSCHACNSQCSKKIYSMFLNLIFFQVPNNYFLSYHLIHKFQIKIIKFLYFKKGGESHITSSMLFERVTNVAKSAWIHYASSLKMPSYLWLWKKYIRDRWQQLHSRQLIVVVEFIGLSL